MLRILFSGSSGDIEDVWHLLDRVKNVLNENGIEVNEPVKYKTAQYLYLQTDDLFIEGTSKY